MGTMKSTTYILLLLLVWTTDVAMPPRSEEIFFPTTQEVFHV